MMDPNSIRPQLRLLLFTPTIVKRKYHIVSLSNDRIMQILWVLYQFEMKMVLQNYKNDLLN